MGYSLKAYATGDIMPLRRSFFTSPGRILLSSILITISTGAALLALPWAQKTSHNLIDLIFTATSATCVTGLLTIPIHEFTLFGHAIILVLMQIGGLGLVTIAVFFISLFVDIGLNTQNITGQILEIDSWKRSKKTLFFIITFTLVVEFLATIIIYYTLDTTYDHPLFLSFFHAVSAFCSAGFTIFPHPFTQFSTHMPFLSITILLMLIGEVGFITWQELLTYAQALKNKRYFKISLHTRLVLITTTLIIIISTSILALTEYGIFSSGSVIHDGINSIFNALSYRSTGFSTLNILQVGNATLLLIIALSFIGSSPGSTGSGIKTTTFALLIAAIKTVILGRHVVDIKGRQIPNDQIFKAMSIFSLGIGLIGCSAFCLFLTDNSWSFIEIFFESSSAFTNLGLSLGITPHLSVIGKIILIISMIMGRIGTLTLILALRWRQDKVQFNYPEERVMIG